MTRRRLLSSLPASLALASWPARGEAGGLRAGAATSNITPPLGISLDGPISQGGAALHVHDDLHVRCLALDDGATRLAIAICDSTMIGRDVFDEAKNLAADRVGITPDRILLAATHTHSTPRLGVHNGELERWYRQMLPRRIADGLIRAVNNLAPARIGWGSEPVPDYLFNRRWFVKPESIPANPFGETGELVQMNPPAGSPNLIRPAGPVDPELFVVSVRHEDGRPLALLANYGLHYIGGGRRGDISADYFGMFASKVGELLGAERQEPPFVGMMSNGRSGDVNAIDFRKERERQPPYERMRVVADDLARRAVGIANRAAHGSGLSLGASFGELEVGLRQPDSQRVAWASKLWAEARGKDQLSRPEVYARETLALAELGARVRIPMQALRIGELGIAAIPCEVFAETGLAIKERSPFEATFTIELANGYNGYLPSKQQHEWGGYETWDARSSQLEVEAEGKIRAEAVRLLENLT